MVKYASQILSTKYSEISSTVLWTSALALASGENNEIYVIFMYMPHPVTLSEIGTSTLAQDT